MADVTISWKNSQGKIVSNTFPEKYANGIMKYLTKLDVDPKMD